MSLLDDLEIDPKTLRVNARESKHREFKRSYQVGDRASYAKVVASFANTDSGQLIFGIEDKPRVLVGIEDATWSDDAIWINFLRTHFDPAIEIRVSLETGFGYSIGVLAVSPSNRKPVICRKTCTQLLPDKAGTRRDVTVLSEGSIYYRYGSESRSIGYSELMEILRERETRLLKNLADNVKMITELAPERLGVIDLSSESKPGSGSKFYVSPDTARELKFVKASDISDADVPKAFVAAGTIQLLEVVTAPLAEQDKNLPTDVVTELRSIIDRVYWKELPFTGSQVAQLAAWTGIRKKGNCDQRYCVEEKKLKRVFYTRAGIALMRSAIETDPKGAIDSFGSKAAKARFQTSLKP